MSYFLAAHAWELMTALVGLSIWLVGALCGVFFADRVLHHYRISPIIEINRRRWRYIQFIGMVHEEAWHMLTPEQRGRLRLSKDLIALEQFGEQDGESIQP